MTFVPRLMVMWAGSKLKSWIKTVLVGCFALAVGCFCAPEADTKNRVLTTTTAPTVINKIMRLTSVTSSFSFSLLLTPHSGAFVYKGSTQLDAWSDCSPECVEEKFSEVRRDKVAKATSRMGVAVPFSVV